MNRPAIAFLLLLMGALPLAGCASEALPLYRPFGRQAGFSEVEIAPSRYQVTYQGTPGMSDGAAAEFAKLRAAELARRAGVEHFRVANLHMNSRTYMDYEPAWYTTDSFIDSDGDTHYHQYMLREGHYDTYSVPVAVMVVELLNGPAPDAFSAQEVWERAITTGLVHPPATRPAG